MKSFDFDRLNGAKYHVVLENPRGSLSLGGTGGSRSRARGVRPAAMVLLARRISRRQAIRSRTTRRRRRSTPRSRILAKRTSRTSRLGLSPPRSDVNKQQNNKQQTTNSKQQTTNNDKSQNKNRTKANRTPRRPKGSPATVPRIPRTAPGTRQLLVVVKKTPYPYVSTPPLVLGAAAAARSTPVTGRRGGAQSVCAAPRTAAGRWGAILMCHSGTRSKYLMRPQPSRARSLRATALRDRYFVRLQP